MFIEPVPACVQKTHAPRDTCFEGGALANDRNYTVEEITTSIAFGKWLTDVFLTAVIAAYSNREALGVAIAICDLRSFRANLA
jgi:hypothetical protein